MSVHFDGRLFPGVPLYCEGHEKPLCRGWVHCLSACSVPFLALGIRSRCKTSKAKVSLSVLTITSLACYGASAAFHMVPWKHGHEILVQKLDHCSILLLAAGSYVPFCLALPLEQALGLLGASWSAALVGGYMTLVHGIGSPFPKIVTTATIAPFLPTLYKTLPFPVFSALLSTLGLYVGGLAIYKTKRPTLLPSHFGYHELFHCLISGAGLLTWWIHGHTLGL